MTWKTTALADSPFALWAFQETTGTTATDGGGSGYDGTYTGTYALAQTGPQTGMRCVDVHGGAGYVTVADQAGIRGTGDHMSFEFILKAASSSPGTNVAIIEKMSSDSNSGWSVRTGDGTPIELRWSGINWAATWPAGWDTAWHHYVLVVDVDSGSGHSKFLWYVDGSLIYSSTTFADIVLTPDTSHPLNIMANRDGSPFPGYIAGVAIYNSSLNATQVTAHYAAYNQAQGSVYSVDIAVDETSTDVDVATAQGPDVSVAITESGAVALTPIVPVFTVPTLSIANEGSFSGLCQLVDTVEVDMVETLSQIGIADAIAYGGGLTLSVTETEVVAVTAPSRRLVTISAAETEVMAVEEELRRLYTTTGFICNNNTTGNHELYAASGTIQLTNDATYDSWEPKVGPDRRTVAFLRTTAGVGGSKESAAALATASLWTIRLDGSGLTQRVSAPSALVGYGSAAMVRIVHHEWSPDGTEITLLGSDATYNYILVVSTTTWLVTKTALRLVRTPGSIDLYDPSYSLDGTDIWCVAQVAGNFWIGNCPNVDAANPAITFAGVYNNSTVQCYDPYISPDGTTLSFLQKNSSTDYSLEKVASGGGTKADIVNDGLITSRGIWIDNATLYTHRWTGGANASIWSVDQDGSNLTDTGFRGEYPDVVPIFAQASTGRGHRTRHRR